MKDENQHIWEWLSNLRLRENHATEAQHFRAAYGESIEPVLAEMYTLIP